MRTSFSIQSKDNTEKNFWNTLIKKMNVKPEMMKFASSVDIEKPHEIVKEGLVISYKPNGEYIIRLGHKSDIVVRGIAKQEQELQRQVNSALTYLKNISPKYAEELKKIEAAKRDILVYKDIDRCRDCVWYESDTSHETYRDKCKNCVYATLGGELNNFMPRSMQVVIFTPDWYNSGDVASVKPSDIKAFQGSLSLLDSHRKGTQDDRHPISIAKEILAIVTNQSPVSLGTALFKYFQTNKLNFQKYGKRVIEAIEQESGIQIHTEDKEKKTVALAVEKSLTTPKFVIENMEVNDQAKVKIKMKDKTKETQESPVAKEAGLNKKSEEGASLQKYERVHVKSDPEIKGTFMQVQDSKPADVDDVVVLDEEFEGHHVIEIAPVDLESEGMADDEQKAFADQQYATYKEELGAYEGEGFKEKVEQVIEHEDTTEKESLTAAKKDKEYPKVPGSMPKVKQEELDKYEKEPKDNYIKSKEIMPKGSFAGTLCLAEVR